VPLFTLRAKRKVFIMTKTSKTIAPAAAAATTGAASIAASVKDVLQQENIKHVFTDMDATMGSFWYYYVPAMENYLNFMHTKHGINKTELEREIGRVTHENGTHEYGWMLEMTKFRKEFEGTSAEFCDKFVVPFWQCLDEARARYLRPFRDVMETLHELRQKGITVTIVSDAPLFMGLTRACDMRLDGPVTALFALDCPMPTVDQFFHPDDMAYGLERMQRLESRINHFDMVVKMPKDHEKPNKAGLEMAMKAMGATAENSIFIGDNLKKDGGVAQAANMRFVWASYGLILPTQYEEMIDVRMTPTGQMPTNGHGVGYRPKVYPPMVAEATSYATLLKHLGDEALPTEPTTLNPSATDFAPEQRSGH
jgi:FMN phosphatase YigB (HAD superfamily)